MRCWSFPKEKIRRRAKMFFVERSGSTALFFALMLPVLLASVALAIEYSSGANFKSQLQASADSAALTAASSMANGATAAQAQATATSVFVASAPVNAPNPSSATASATLNNDIATVSLSYSGARPSAFSKLYGNNGAVSITSKAQASIYGGSGGATTTYSGRGSLWGDPHLTSDNAAGGYFVCDTSGKTWYNALSDAGIEINFNCAYDSYFQAVYMQSIVVIIGSHVYTTVAAAPVYDSSGVQTYTGNYLCGGKLAGYWCGSLTVDGVYHDASASLGNTYYLGSGSSTGTSKCDLSVASSGNFLYQQIQDITAADESNSIQICYFNGATVYQIQINYDQYEQGSISIAATSAGQCGIPGGMLGQTVVGASDLTSGDFTVPSSTATTAQFKYQTCTTSVTAQGKLRLIQ